MGGIWQDVRFAVRLLVKDLAFTLTVIVSLALAIGANTAVFTFLNGIFLRPPGVASPERLVVVASVDPTDPRGMPQSYPNYLDFRDRNRVFSGLAAFQAFDASLSGDGSPPEEVYGQMVSANYFDVLGVKTSLGRSFLPEEDVIPNQRPVVILSYALWRSRFAADPHMIGRVILLNTHPFTVVGVAAPGWVGPGKRVAFKLWVPMMMFRQVFLEPDRFFDRAWRLVYAIGRLPPGITIERATIEMKAVAAELEREHPDSNRGQTAIVLPFINVVLGLNDGRMFFRAGLLLSAVVCLLLLCA
jgi:MacB-like periplasmic core domain